MKNSPGGGCRLSSSSTASTLFLFGRLLIGGGQFFWPSLLMLILWGPVHEMFAIYDIRVSNPLLISMVLLFLIGGLFLTIGYWVRTTCAILTFFGVAFLLWKMRFWQLDGFQRYIIETLALNFLVVAGGMLYFINCGPGRYGVSCREPRWLKGDHSTALLILIARLLIGGVFLYHGVMKIAQWPLYYGLLLENRIGFPMTVLVMISAIETLGGLFIIMGWRVRIAALVVLIYFIFILIGSWESWETSLEYMIVIRSPSAEQIFRRELLPVSELLRMKFFSDHIGIFGTLLLVVGSPKVGYHAEIHLARNGEIRDGE